MRFPSSLIAVIYHKLLSESISYSRAFRDLKNLDKTVFFWNDGQKDRLCWETEIIRFRLNLEG